ncbi:MAG: hypothetical protein EKK69_05595, partial [Candidatus Competibacteraceae bacterium]
SVVTLSPSAQPGSVFVGWDGACSGTATCTVTMDTAKSVTARFNLVNELSVTVKSATGSSGGVTSIPDGINCGADCAEVYAANTTVTLTAVAGTNSVFVGWAEACASAGKALSCDVTIDAAKNVTAYFAPALSVTVIKGGTGSGTVTSSPSGIACGSDCSESYLLNTTVTLTATAQPGSAFTGWSDACSGATATCQVLVDAAKSVTATFTLDNTLSLTVNKSGSGAANGKIVSNPAGIDCGSDCSGSYAKDSTVTLTATSGSDAVFTGWSGACSGTASSCTVTMNEARTVTAFFSIAYPLTVSKSGSGSGRVVSSPEGIFCGTDCQESYPSGTSVTLTPIPDSGSVFVSWSEACSGTGTCTVSMSEARSVNANFAPLKTLTVSKTGTGSDAGTVTSAPAGINCGSDCSEGYPINTPVTLAATPAANMSFTGWGGACTGTATTCTVVLDTDRTVSANFQSVQHNLTIVKNGSGTVTSTPVGIDCGSDCSENYNYGTTVSLNAIPATGYQFSGWSGACTGSASCTVTMTAARSVTAVFAPITYALTTSRAGTGSGTVTSDTGGINCGATCQVNFVAGTVVTLTATPASGSAFSGWSGACTGTGTCAVTMDAAKSVTATFGSTTLPDLVLTSLVSPGPGTNGQRNVNFRLTVANQGAAAAGSFKVGLYFTIDSTVDPATDVNSGTECNVSSLAVNATYVCEGNIVLPASLPSGVYLLGAYADPQNQIAELSKANNSRVTTNTFTIYRLNVVVDAAGNGTVYSQPSGINCSISSNCEIPFLSGDTVTLTQAAKTGYSFANWSGACTGTASTCTVTMNANKNVVARYTFLPNYTLTVSKAGTGAGTVASNPAGISCGTDCSESYTSGASVTLTASAASGSTFTGWSGACSGTDTCTVSMDAAKAVTATFTLPGYTLTVNKAGTGSGTVTSDPAGISCSTDCSESYTSGASVTLIATTASGSTFTGWSGACSGTSTCTVSMDAAKSVTANFMLSSYALTVAKAGTGSGTVTSDPAGISCSTDCSESYTSGASVTLTARAASGSTFAGWSGACSGTSTCTVSMDAAKAVTATFNLPRYTLTVRTAGTGSGTVTSDPAGISCGTDCSESYTSGTAVTLTASAASGSTFAGWSGACSGTSTCKVSMSAAKTVTATFLPRYTLTVSKAGTGSGTVASNPAGISCGTDCSESYTSSTAVTLTARAASGSTFAGWSGACTGTASTCKVSMDAAKEVTATFTPPRYTLTVRKAGTGSGTVTSDPAGISCSTDCSEPYTSGASVTLTATTASGSTFAGWSGVCSGTSTCTVTMSAAKTVTATFNRSMSSSYPTEAALLTTLVPGAYTAIVRGAGVTTGNALVEVFDQD